MPKQKITVEFTQTGAPQLIKSIRDLANEKNKLNGISKEVTKNAKKQQKAQQRVTKANRDGEKGFEGLLTTAALARNKLLLVSFAAGLVVKPIANITRNAINAAASFQSLQVRLNQLFGSLGEGKAAFDQFNAQAAKTPFALEDIVNAGAQLKAFGADSRELLTEITDLAAFMGTNATEAANSFGRAFAGGAGAADILRERGVLNLVKSFAKVDDISKLTLPEFRKALIGAMRDPLIGIQGATAAMADTYVGRLSNMQDATQRMQADLGNLLMPAAEKTMGVVTNLANEIGRLFKEMNESPLATLVREMEELGVEAQKLAGFKIILNTEDSIEKIANLATDVKDLRKELFDLGDFDEFMFMDFGDIGTGMEQMEKMNSFLKDELGESLSSIEKSFAGEGGLFDIENTKSMEDAIGDLTGALLTARGEILENVSATGEQTEADKAAFEAGSRNIRYLASLVTKIQQVIKVRKDQADLEDYYQGILEGREGEKPIFSVEDMEFIKIYKKILADSNEERVKVIDKQIEMLKLFEKEGRFLKANTFEAGQFEIVLKALNDQRDKLLENPIVKEDDVMTLQKMQDELKKQRDEYTNLQTILKDIEDSGFYDKNKIPDHLRELTDETKTLNDENKKLQDRLTSLYKGTEKSQKEAIQSNIDFLKSNRDNEEMLSKVGMTVDDVDAAIKKYTQDLNKLNDVLELQSYPEFLAQIKKQASEFKNSSNNMDILIKNFPLLDEVYRNYIKTQVMGLETTDDVNREIAKGVIELQNFEDMQKHVEGMYHGMNDMQKKVAESLGFLSDEFKELNGIGVEKTFGNIESKLKSLFDASTKGTVANFMGDFSDYKAQRADLVAQIDAEETSADQKEELAKRIKTLDAGYKILNKQFQDYTNGLHVGGRALTKVMQLSKKHNSEQRNELVAYSKALNAIDENSMSTEALANEKRNATKAIHEFDAANGDTDAAFKLYVMNAQDSIEADKLAEEHKQMLIDKFPELAEAIGFVNQGFTSYVKALEESKSKEDEALRNKMHLINTDRDQARELGLLGDTYKEFKNNLEVQIATRQHLIDKTKQLKKEETDLYNEMVKTGKIQSVEQLEGTEDPYLKFKKGIEDKIKSQKEEEGILEKLIRLEPVLFEQAVKRNILNEELTDAQIKQNQQFESLIGLIDQVEVSSDIKLQKDLENLNAIRQSKELQEKYNVTLDDLDVIQQQVIKNFQKSSEEANKANKELQEFINTTAEDISGFGDSPNLLGENPFQEEIDALSEFQEEYQNMVDGMQNPTDQMINTLQSVQDQIDHLTEVGKFLQVGETIIEIAEGFMTSIEMVVSSYSERTQAALDEDMDRLKNSMQYQKSSREAQVKMEEGIKKKHQEDALRAFRFQKALQIAETVMNTATSIMQAIELNPGGLGLPQSAIIAAQGAAQLTAIASQQAPSYEFGGLVGGRRHSGGGTLIEAERGEFVMSRTAVKNIGVSTLDRMNRGMGGSQSINIVFEGNLLSDDFIIDEAIPKIRDAIRRGETLTD
jgi:DNA repair exonuclease SbcCD ATPase subunit